MLGLYRFEEDCYRMGIISGLFISEEKDVIDAIGKTIYMSDVLGKHSEFEIELGDENITEITMDVSIIEKLLDAFGSSDLCGYNPLNYLEE